MGISSLPAKRFETSEFARYEKYGSGEEGELIMKNLSATGAKFQFFSSQLSVNKGDLLRFTIQLNQLGKSRTFNAEVVWQNEKEVGVCFVHPEQLWEKLITR